MSNYVSRMKDVTVSFNRTALEIRNKMDYNNQHFNADYAGEENARLQAEMNRAADQARGQIDSIHNEAAAAARKWAEPSGENIDTADLNLLKGDFDLSAEDLHMLLVKHQWNSVMVNAIAKYAKEHDIPLDYVPNLEDKLYAYKSFAGSAHNEISNIVGSIGMSESRMELWAKPGNISQRMETVLYGIKKHEAPEAAPQLPEGNFNFGFGKLPGR